MRSMGGRADAPWEKAVRSDDLTRGDGGAASVERRGSEPLCSFDREKDFPINATTVDELRWYRQMSSEELDEGLLESEHDD
jgi:hypothetical protein